MAGAPGSGPWVWPQVDRDGRGRAKPHPPQAPQRGGGARPGASEGEGVHHPHHHDVAQRRYDGDPEQDGIVGGPRGLLGLALAAGGRVDVGGGVEERVLGAEVLIGRVHEGPSHHGQLGRTERELSGSWARGKNRRPEGPLPGQANTQRVPEPGSA